MEIKNIKLQDLLDLKNNDYEYLVLQGCGGDLNEYVDGLSEMLKDAQITPQNFKFNEVYSFDNKNLTNLVFSLNNKDINMGKLAIFRLQIREVFGAMWLSDYIDNNLEDISFNGGISI